jgi:hypothetical protein
MFSKFDTNADVPGEILPEGKRELAGEIKGWIGGDLKIHYNLDYLRTLLPEGYKLDLDAMGNPMLQAPGGAPVLLRSLIKGRNATPEAQNLWKEMENIKNHEEIHRLISIKMEYRAMKQFMAMFATPAGDGKVPEGKIPLTGQDGKEPLPVNEKNVEEFLAYVADGSLKVNDGQRTKLETLLKQYIPGFSFVDARMLAHAELVKARGAGDLDFYRSGPAAGRVASKYTATAIREREARQKRERMEAREAEEEPVLEEPREEKEEPVKEIPEVKKITEAAEKLTPGEVSEKLHDPHFLPASRQQVIDAFPDWNEFTMFSNRPGDLTFEVLNEEYVDGLVNYLAKKIPSDRPLRILEVGAGNGRLTHFLKQKLDAKAPGKVEIVATDSGEWPLNNAFPVEKLTHQEALRKYKPDIVLCSWMSPGVDLTKEIRQTGSVEEYILIGEAGADGCCGDGKVTWGSSKYRVDGFEKQNLDNLSKLQLGRTDYRDPMSKPPRMIFHSSTVSFRRARAEADIKEKKWWAQASGKKQMETAAPVEAAPLQTGSGEKKWWVQASEKKQVVIAPKKPDELQWPDESKSWGLLKESSNEAARLDYKTKLQSLQNAPARFPNSDAKVNPLVDSLAGKKQVQHDEIFKKYNEALNDYSDADHPFDKSKCDLLSDGAGYKFHLNVEPADVKAVSEYLIKEGYRHKYLHGGEIEDGKIFTIYIGSKDLAEKLAPKLSSDLHTYLRKPVETGEIEFAPNIVGRFVGTRSHFQQYGMGLRGIVITKEWAKVLQYQNPKEKQRLMPIAFNASFGLLADKYGTYFYGTH